MYFSAREPASCQKPGKVFARGIASGVFVLGLFVMPAVPALIPIVCGFPMAVDTANIDGQHPAPPKSNARNIHNGAGLFPNSSWKPVFSGITNHVQPFSPLQSAGVL